MTTETVAAGMAIAFLAAVCQSVTGFGFALTMTPLLVLVWDVKSTIATSLLLGFVILFPLIAEVRGHVSVNRVSGMFAGFLIGLAPGVFLLQQLNSDALRIIVAGTVMVASALMYRAPPVAAGRDSIPLRVFAGAVSGTVGASTSLGGPPAVLYLLGRERDIPSFRGTIMAFFFAGNVVTIAAFVIVGRITGDVLLMSAAALPAVAAGIIAGGWLRRRLDPQAFRGLVLGLLVVTSLAVLTGSLLKIA